MIKQGYGGRGGNSNNEPKRFDGYPTVLSGLLFPDWPDDVFFTEAVSLAEQSCANRKCSRYFRPRAEGDIYCSEACDLDANLHFKPVRVTPNPNNPKSVEKRIERREWYRWKAQNDQSCNTD